MITTKVYSVFDSKAALFGRPFYDQQDASAIRNFADAVNDGSNPSNMWNKHPEDFSLFLIGEFDDESGKLIPCLPQSLVTASALRAVKSNGVNPLQQELVQ